MANPPGGGVPTFNVDTAAFDAANKALQSMNTATSITKQNMMEINNALNLISKAQQDMGKYAFVNPNAEKKVKEIQKSLEKIGMTRKAMQTALNKEVTSYEKLGWMEKRRVKSLIEQTKAQERIVYYQGQQVTLAAKQRLFENAGARTLNTLKGTTMNLARGAASYASSWTGIQFSVAGIVALLLELQNESSKIGAMTKQITAQWKESNTAAGTARSTMSKLRNVYMMSVDAAGNLTNSIAQAGIEEEHIKRVSEEAYAIELARGIGVQTTLKSYEELVENAGRSSEEALNFQEAIRESVKAIPGLSMEEAVTDMMGLVSNSREFVKNGADYNTHLLATLSMYNSLMNKDVAKGLGFDNLSQESAKELSSVASNFNKSLSDGWQAVLGGAGKDGKSAADAIMSFRKLTDPEKMAAVAKQAIEMTAGKTGNERLLALEKVLEGMGPFSENLQEVLSKTFANENFSPEGFIDLAKSVGEGNQTAAQAAAAEKAGREELLVSAKQIAYGLMGFEQKLAMSIKNGLLGSPEWANLQRDISSFTNMLITEAPGFFQKGLGILGDLVDAMKTLADAIKYMPGGQASKQVSASETVEESRKVAQNAQRMFHERSTEALRTGLPSAMVPEAYQGEARKGMMEKINVGAATYDITQSVVQLLQKKVTQESIANLTPQKYGFEDIFKGNVSADSRRGVLAEAALSTFDPSELRAYIDAKNMGDVGKMMKLVQDNIDEALGRGTSRQLAENKVIGVGGPPAALKP